MTAHIAAAPDLVWLAAAAVVLWWLNRRGRLRSITRRAGRLAAAAVAVVLAATVSTSAVVVVVLVVGCLAVGGRHTRRHYRRQAQLSRWFWQGYNRASRRRRVVRRRVRRPAVYVEREAARQAWMASRGWQRQRLAALERANYRCQNPSCRSPHRLEVHHNNDEVYGHLPQARPSDLTVLCSLCHTKVGSLHRRDAYGVRRYSIAEATRMVMDAQVSA